MTIPIKALCQLNNCLIEKSTIVFDKGLRKYCKPYINFNKNSLCPPRFPYQEAIISEYSTFRLVYVKFNFKKYKELRRRKYPNWTDKQLGNSRHWQNTLKSLLKKYISNFHYSYMLGCGGGGLNGYGSMEAGGCNVFETCASNGILLEGKFLEPIETYIHLVCLLMF